MPDGVIGCLCVQWCAALVLEFAAWHFARARFDGLIATADTRKCVAAEAIIQICAFYVLVDQTGLLDRVAVGAANVAGAVAGWDCRARWGSGFSSAVSRGITLCTGVQHSEVSSAADRQEPDPDDIAG